VACFQGADQDAPWEELLIQSIVCEPE